MNLDTLFLNLISNTLRVSCTLLDNDDAISAFSNKYCYHKDLQPMLTYDSLCLLTSSMVQDTYYEIRDSLGVSVIMFKYNNHSYIVGPFATSRFDDSSLEVILLKKKVPSSFHIPIKLYCTSLEVISSFYVQSLLNGLISSFEENPTEFQYRLLHGVDKTSSPANLRQETPIHYDTIYLRYERENTLLDTIRNGDLQGLTSAYSEVISPNNHNEDPFFQDKVNGAFAMYYKSPHIGSALIRGMARKAAEEAGLSIIKIDEITQHYTQLMNSSRDASDIPVLTYNMLYDLTKGVHEIKVDSSHLSDQVAKVLEFISLNYSQDIQLKQLAEIAGFSEAHLSKKFKKETNMTLIEAVAKYRLEKAADLLATSDLPIQEISMYVGYLDNNYFVKVFKKHFGVTPSIYRNNNTR